MLMTQAVQARPRYEGIDVGTNGNHSAVYTIFLATTTVKTDTKEWTQFIIDISVVIVIDISVVLKVVIVLKLMVVNTIIYLIVVLNLITVPIIHIDIYYILIIIYYIMIITNIASKLITHQHLHYIIDIIVSVTAIYRSQHRLGNVPHVP